MPQSPTSKPNNRRCSTIRRLLSVAAVLVALAVTPGISGAQAHHKGPHVPGCRTHKCDVHIGKVWAKHHVAKPAGWGSFEICVANRENGEPGSHRLSDIKPGNKFQFTQETWEAAGMKGSPSSASDATQLDAFRRWEPGHPTAWPNTLPPCL